MNHSSHALNVRKIAGFAIKIGTTPHWFRDVTKKMTSSVISYFLTRKIGFSSSVKYILREFFTLKTSEKHTIGKNMLFTLTLEYQFDRLKNVAFKYQLITFQIQIR